MLLEPDCLGFDYLERATWYDVIALIPSYPQKLLGTGKLKTSHAGKTKMLVHLGRLSICTKTGKIIMTFIYIYIYLYVYIFIHTYVMFRIILGTR